MLWLSSFRIFLIYNDMVGMHFATVNETCAVGSLIGVGLEDFGKDVTLRKMH